MNCISSRHACFYGGLVDTYKIPSKQNFVYSDEYQSTRLATVRNIDMFGEKKNFFLY